MTTGFGLLYGAGIQTQLDGALVRVEYQFTELDDLTLPRVQLEQQQDELVEFQHRLGSEVVFAS
jgi:hypothetical protein